MKIWIDFINSPQVSFILPFIEDLSADGNEFILTARDSGNTIDLLRLHGLNFEVIGKKAEQKFITKMLHFPLRVLALWRYMRKHKTDVAFCQSSFYLPVVASLLRIPSIYTNDNEYAKGNYIAFLFAKRVILPEVLRQEPFASYRFLRKKLQFYPGVKEAIYLSHNHPKQDNLSFHQPKTELSPVSEMNQASQSGQYSAEENGSVLNKSAVVNLQKELNPAGMLVSDFVTSDPVIIDPPLKHIAIEESKPELGKSDPIHSEKSLTSNSGERNPRIIFFRPEPFSAQYYKGSRNFMDNVLIELAEKYDVVILPREHKQGEHYKHPEFARVKVADNPVKLDEIVRRCFLFIGAGGSMTRELAVLGVPVISVYQDSLLKVDHYLMDKGLIILNPRIETKEIISFLKERAYSSEQLELMEEGIKSYNQIKSLIISEGHG